jgi:glycosyltransferase involved in cell wall biosynthesis
LKFAYFKNFDWRRPFWVTNDIHERPRIRVGLNSALKDLYTTYAEQVEANSRLITGLPTDEENQGLYGWDFCFPGIKISPSLRFIYRAEWCLDEGDNNSPPPTPFGENNIDEFIDWLNGETRLKGLKVQRFVLSIFMDRPDIHRDFVRGPSVNHVGFKRWLFDFARAEVPLTRYTTFFYSQREIKNIGRSRDGTDVIGSLNSEHGLGEAGRLLVSALEQTPEKISTIAFKPAGVRAEHQFNASNESRYRTTVIALNPEQIRDLWNDYGNELRADRYVIGQWFWELEMAPPWYAEAFSDHAVDELWAPTRFIETMLREAAPPHVPVVYMPLPFAQPDVNQQFTFASVGLAEKYSFLFTFDFGSVMKRKNPEGAVEAFKRAFAPNEGPQLIIKSINGDVRPREFEQLMWARDGRDDIILLDNYLDNDENAALISLSDCYVSLHRSEGLGLTMAEAMLLEKPVIATGYSGNLDFMNAENSYLVPWQYTPVGSDADAYPRNANWAEPDLDEAARLMRYVYEHQVEAREVGKMARVFIETNFSTNATGERMHQRLKELRGSK